MKFAKIHFESRETSIKAFHGLTQRGRVIGLRNQTFIVPEPALEWLASVQLPYQLIEWMSSDDLARYPSPDELHSHEQFFTPALPRSISRVIPDPFLEARAKRSTGEGIKKFLAAAGNEPPIETDRI